MARRTVLIIPTVDLVTLTVRTLALCAMRKPALVFFPNLTGSLLGVVCLMKRSAELYIILDDHELKPRIPLLNVSYLLQQSISEGRSTDLR